MNKAVFFDRDGVLNAPRILDGQVWSPRTFADFHLDPDAGAAVRGVQALGFLAIVVTNQPDISRGLMPQSELDRMHAALREVAPVDDLLVCPHDDRDRCDCRKPKPGMLLAAAKRHHLDLAACVIVGDTWKDMDAGRAAGCHTVLRARDYNTDVAADAIIQRLAELPDLLRPACCGGGPRA